MLAPESLKRVHPLGKSPVIEDNGLILAESGAILEYLQETYDAESQLKPLDPAHKVQYRFWLHYAEGSLMPLLLMKLVFSSLGKPPVPFGIRTLGKALGQGVQKPISIPSSKPTRVLLNLTAENSWFAGETLSMADIQMSFPILPCWRGGVEDLPHTHAGRKGRKSSCGREPGTGRAVNDPGEA